MNERIKTLYTEACKDLDITQDILQKFAELMVGEVLGRIQIHQQMDEATEEWVYTSLKEDIKEHFGVE